MGPPNILYLHSHDTGRYVQPYGHAVATPSIQKLAEEGVLFRQAFCTAPTCSPSRAALLTGQSPHSSGMLGLAHRGFSLKDYGQHIIHALRPAGYASTLIGVQHITRDPGVIGYDHVLDTGGNKVSQVAPVAVDFLSSPPPEPFFLSVGFGGTHRAYPTPGKEARYARPPVPIPDSPETRYDMAAFNASARELDRGMGVVLDSLEASGLDERTLVICTTDHGIAFPSMKCNLKDGGIAVMLIMRGPDGFAGGKVVDALVSHIDIYPTLCELLGIQKPAWLQGRSMMPLIRGESDEINEEIYAEVTYHAAYEPQRALRTKEWKYIRRFGDRTKPVLPNCDDSPTKDLWLRNGWRDMLVAKEQLYNLIFDPTETNNLAANPEYSGILEEMRNRLESWMMRTDDPLLKGPVPAPKGAVVNDPDGISPKERPRAPKI